MVRCKVSMHCGNMQDMTNSDQCVLEDLFATEALGRRLATCLSTGLIRTLCHDAALDVPSPTYTFVQSYQTPEFEVSHFDLWRLDEPGGLIELGWDQARDGVVLVEWPDRLGALTPENALTLTLQRFSDASDRRFASFSGWDSHRRATLSGSLSS